MIIYKTINKVNGKFYIGVDTKNNPDYFGSGIYLIRAIKKYGKENFIKEIVETCKTEKQLYKREKVWIKETRATEIGYNISEGGKGVGSGENHPMYGKTGKKSPLYGKKHPEQSKRMKENNPMKRPEIRKKFIGKNNPMYGKVGENNPNYGSRRSEETRQKMSESMKGKNHPSIMGENNPAKRLEVKEKISKNHARYWSGKTFSEEHRKRLSESHKKIKKD